MTKIKFSYTKNTKGKYTFKLTQDNVVLFQKEYTPKIEQNQHLLGEAIVEVFNKHVQHELDANPNFKWLSFDDAKKWMAMPCHIDDAITLKNSKLQKNQ